MCFGPRSSLASFLVGSLLNVWILMQLERNHAPSLTSLDAPTHAALVTIVVSVQFALLMQVVEGIAWLDLEQTKGWNYMAAKAALPLNVLQPAVLVLVALLTRSAPTRELSIACVILLIYLSITHVVCNAESEWTSLSMVGPTCPHIDLIWWSHPLLRQSYVFCLFLLLFLVLDSIHVRIATMLFLGASLLFSSWLYGCTNGVTGSIWCWLVALGPISIYGLCSWWVPLE